MIEDTDSPRLADHAKLRFNEVRQEWAILLPEKILVLDEQALEVIKLIDGKRYFAEIIAHLAHEYDTPHDIIAEDVGNLLEDLRQKGIVAW